MNHKKNAEYNMELVDLKIGKIKLDMELATHLYNEMNALEDEANGLYGALLETHANVDLAERRLENAIDKLICEMEKGHKHSIDDIEEIFDTTYAALKAATNEAETKL